MYGSVVQVWGHRRPQTLRRKPRDGPGPETADGRMSSVGTPGGASPPPNATCRVHPICVLTHEPTRQLGLNIGEPSRMKMGNEAGIGCGGARPGRSPSLGFRTDGEVVVQTPGGWPPEVSWSPRRVDLSIIWPPLLCSPSRPCVTP